MPDPTYDRFDALRELVLLHNPTGVHSAASKQIEFTEAFRLGAEEGFDMSDGEDVEVSALAINVTVPESLRWTDVRRGQTFELTTLNVRLLPDGHLAAKAYGRPVEGGRAGYVSFRVPDRPELKALIAEAADRAGSLWASHREIE